MRAKAGEKQYGLRLPEWIVAALKAEAAQQRRSLNAQVVVVLESYATQRGHSAPIQPTPAEVEQAALRKQSDAVFGPEV